MNPYGPNCAPADRTMCNLCNVHFRSGGSQRCHQCLSGFTTRCMRELINHIMCQQYLEVNEELNEYNLVDGDLHRVNCICRNLTYITDLHNA